MLENYNFKHLDVRNLAWVMKSPSLLKNDRRARLVSDQDCHDIHEKNFDWLLNLDANPNELINWLEKNNTRRLGYYFECLVEFWLQHKIARQVFPHLQVFNKERTIGEFDFLFNDQQTDEFIHWEVAIKLYLHFIDSDGKQWWFGPNGHDRLDLKLKHLYERQLQLATTEDGQRKLSELGNTTVSSKLLLKGYLFNSPDCGAIGQQCLNFNLSSQYLHGWWLKYPTKQLPQSTADSRWIILSKHEWLAPSVRGEDDSLLDNVQIAEKCDLHFQSDTHAILVAEMVKMSEQWQEVARGFVVHPDWPILNKSS